MQGGDISNETPPRILVLVDAVVKYDMTEKRTLTGKKTKVKVTGLNNPALSHLWRQAHRFGLSVELGAIQDEGWEQEHLDYVMDKLERRGGNPFNYAELYDSLEELIGELPYRANLQGVVSAGQAGRFGSWGLDLENL